MGSFFSRLFGKHDERGSFATVGADALRDWRAARDDVVVIDVRGAEEFTGPLGHIPGARNLPLAELATRMGELESLRERNLVLVCLTDKRSAQACTQLVAAGFPRVTLLVGGMREWHARGLAVEGATPG